MWQDRNELSYEHALIHTPDLLWAPSKDREGELAIMTFDLYPSPMIPSNATIHPPHSPFAHKTIRTPNPSSTVLRPGIVSS